MKSLLRVLTLLLLFIPAFSQPEGSHFDESKVPNYVLPELMQSLSGQKINSIKDWEEIRRPELIDLFKTYVYGHEAIGRPDNMSWSVLEEMVVDSTSSIYKKVQILLDGKNFGPKITLEISLPQSEKPVPVILFLSRRHNPGVLLNRGFGLVTFNPNEFEIDNKEKAFNDGVRSYFISPGKTELQDQEWGTLSAWAWGSSRAMDYLQTDLDIDAKKISILGFSRNGKAAVWAGAKDQRFAIVYSAEAGCGGATLLRRGFGETIKAINNYAPHWFNNNFKNYNDKADELPVDYHMMASLVAPRPLYIATAEEDLWGDPKGNFLSGKNAAPAYALYGKTGIGVSSMPEVETPVGDWIGYHNRTGGHGITAYDWKQWLDFADRHFNNR